MKISELMTHLAAIHTVHGDAEVWFGDEGYVSNINFVLIAQEDCTRKIYLQSRVSEGDVEHVDKWEVHGVGLLKTAIEERAVDLSPDAVIAARLAGYLRG